MGVKKMTTVQILASFFGVSEEEVWDAYALQRRLPPFERGCENRSAGARC